MDATGRQRGKHVPATLQACVIYSRLVFEQSWTAIEALTGVNSSTASHLFNKIDRAANHSRNLHEYLALINADYCKRGHRPRRTEPQTVVRKP